ncbi:MAG TPA: response regulator [Verrucomicrobiae bacterium]
MARILVVDDDDLLARLIEQTLVQAGHEVVWAMNGTEAVRLYSPARFDLVVTDLIMPEKEGLELITELKKVDAGVRIIAMSGGGRNGPSGYLPIAKHMGAKAVLRKPFSIVELIKTVESVLLDSGSPR